MAGGRFSKQADWLSQKPNAANANDGAIGGSLSVSPLGSNLGSQFTQTLPGDRVIFSPSDALALMNNTTGNLYTGTYRYANIANASSTPARGHGAFWVPIAFNNNQAVQDALYQVTSDELGNYGVSLFAGVFINTPGKSNNNGNIYWWLQESGKVAAQFRVAISAGTPAIGAGVYLTGGGNNNNAVDVGSFDQLTGLNSGTTFAANTAGANSAWTALDSAMVRFVGVAEQVPSNNNISVVDLFLNRASFRW